jgi:membrane associated rhomboid family serine protease
MKIPPQEIISTEKKEQIDDFKLKLGRIWANIPLFVKFYFIVTTILYLLNLPIKFISYSLINIPSYTILHFQLWRLLTSVFITTNIFQIILAFFVWVKNASLLETSLGTIKYSLIFFVNAISIQIINIIIISIGSLINSNISNPEIKSKKNSGIWGIVMCEMTLLCISNPESPMKLLLLPFTVKAKIYPIILVILFFISNYLEIDVEIISGIIYGVIYFFLLKTKLQISDSFVQKLESNSLFKKMSSIKGFISVNHISSGGLPISITKVSTVDNEQEKEKLKGKGVKVAGTLDNIKEEEETEQQKNELPSIIEDSTNLK